MKLSSSFFITRRENPKDENFLAAQLLVKAGMILKNENGLYYNYGHGWLPLNESKKK